MSHDRYFLEKTTNTKLVFSNHTIYKQFNEKESSSKREDHEELRLTLETERQEVLGKLSFMTPNNKEYEVLDLRFKELTKLINNLQDWLEGQTLNLSLSIFIRNKSRTICYFIIYLLF